jgi:hypothetical protein
MSKRFLTLVATLALSSMALAQHMSQREAAAARKNAPDTTVCAATFTSGSGHNLTQYCVTANGNITQFSRGGDEYINVLVVTEGYGICDLNSGIRYTDYASSNSGNWQAAAFSSTASKAISTRTTSDGIWQITNTITKVAANASGPGSAKVSMKIKNLTGINRTILLARFADSDFQEGSTVDDQNDFDFTIDYAAGLEPGFKSGLSLTNGTFTFPYDAFTQNTFTGPDPCGPFNVSSQPFFGDGGLVQLYSITVPKLATKTVNMTYKPI